MYTLSISPTCSEPQRQVVGSRCSAQFQWTKCLDVSIKLREGQAPRTIEVKPLFTKCAWALHLSKGVSYLVGDLKHHHANEIKDLLHLSTGDPPRVHPYVEADAHSVLILTSGCLFLMDHDLWYRWHWSMNDWYQFFGHSPHWVRESEVVTLNSGEVTHAYVLRQDKIRPVCV